MNEPTFKLLLLDVDGVLTDGRKTYNKDGMTVYKQFCDKDFTAIKMFRASGVNVAFISGDYTINGRIAQNRNIPFWYTRDKCKSEILPEIWKQFPCDLRQTIFVGDDFFDLGIMKRLFYNVCPADAPQIVKDKCWMVLKNNGGSNCIMELYETLRRKGYIPTFDKRKLLRLDAKEKF